MASHLPISRPTPRLPSTVSNQKLLLWIVINTLLVVSSYFIYREGLRRAQTPAYQSTPSQVLPYRSR